MRTPPLAVVVTVVALAGSIGCSAPPKKVSAAPAPREAPNVSGTWDWMVEERGDDGDTRMEREVWYLTQVGDEIRGYYDRVLTVLSGDGRPFECYRDTRYQKFTRFRIVGNIAGSTVRLRETSYETPPDPCDAGRRRMTVYVGRTDGATLTLRWPPAGMQVLHRRSETPPAASPTDRGGDDETMSAATGNDAPTQSSVGGVWRWQWRVIDANGDTRSTQEEWHLVQRGRQLSGFFDRTVRTVSGAKRPFACSRKPVRAVAARYQVQGEVIGAHVRLTETKASQLAGAPCEVDGPDLTWHEGEVGVEEMVLSSGRSAGEKQVLRRVGPDTASR